MLIIFFILGLIVGSFLNVVVYRLNLLESISGRSKCPHCSKKIRWYDNVPVVSFIILGTKCRDCGEKISWQYPIMEIVTGMLFAATGAYFFEISNLESWVTTVFYLGIFSMLLVVFMYDLKFMEIPMVIIWTAILWAMAYFIYSDWVNFNSAAGVISLKLYSGIIGGSIAYLFFYSLVFISKEKWMGMGDAYLGLLVGLVAGWSGVLLVLLSAFTIGSVAGIILIALKKKSMQSKIPFGPFLVMGLILTIFLNNIFPQLNSYIWYF